MKVHWFKEIWIGAGWIANFNRESEKREYLERIINELFCFCLIVFSFLLVVCHGRSKVMTLYTLPNCAGGFTEDLLEKRCYGSGSFQRDTSPVIYFGSSQPSFRVNHGPSMDWCGGSTCSIASYVSEFSVGCQNFNLTLYKDEVFLSGYGYPK